MKRLLTIIGCAILLALVCIQLYSRYVDSSNVFFLKVAEASDSWAEHIHATERPVFVFAGGSETRSGVIPDIMLREFNMPAINAGEGAEHGLQANAAMAFKYLKSGDTLVLNVLSSKDINIPPSAQGTKMAVYRLKGSVFKSGLIEPDWEMANQFLSSSIHDAFVLAARYFGRSGRLLKYDQQTVIHPDGWMDIRYREMDNYKLHPRESTSTIQPLASDSACLSLLGKLRDYCRENNIRLVVSIPISCEHESFRPEHAIHVLSVTRLGIPVLKDKRLGCLPITTDFADMSAHLNAKGAAENTRLLAHLLQNNDYWTTKELEEALHAMGWNADGTPIIEATKQNHEILQAHP